MGPPGNVPQRSSRPPTSTASRTPGAGRDASPSRPEGPGVSSARFAPNRWPRAARRPGSRGRRRLDPVKVRGRARRPQAIPPVARRERDHAPRVASWKRDDRCSGSAGEPRCSTRSSVERSISTCPTSTGSKDHQPRPGEFGEVRVNPSPARGSQLSMGEAFERRLLAPPGDRQARRRPGRHGAAPTTAWWKLSSSATGFLVGVQWHPEQKADTRLFRALVEAC